MKAFLTNPINRFSAIRFGHKGNIEPAKVRLPEGFVNIVSGKHNYEYQDKDAFTTTTGLLHPSESLIEKSVKILKQVGPFVVISVSNSLLPTGQKQRFDDEFAMQVFHASKV